MSALFDFFAHLLMWLSSAGNFVGGWAAWTDFWANILPK